MTLTIHGIPTCLRSVAALVAVAIGSGGCGGLVSPPTDGLTGGYASVNATSSATSIEFPDYTLDLTTEALALQVDANHIVQAFTGVANLLDGTITGEGYFVDPGTLPASPTFADLDTAYAATTVTAINGANPKVTAAAFGLSGVDLTTPAVRTIAIRRTVSDVRSFEIFQITVSHP